MRPDVELDAEDRKLVTLARAARARAGSAEGAAVRDGDGRTYNAATVSLPSFTVTALQLAVANAVAAGAAKLEAAVIVTSESTVDDASLAAVRDVTAIAPVYVADLDGAVQHTAGQ